MLQKIQDWPAPDWTGLMEFVKPCWSDHGRIWFEDGEWRLATGGWSGNESIIDAMQSNFMFWSMCWQMSRRGGLFFFKLP